MIAALFFLGFIIAQRLTELSISKRNTARLLASGAHEVGAGHYPVMVLLHSAWIACLVVFGWDASVNLFWLVLFVALQFLRAWVLTTLGPRWTTRIIVTDQPLVVVGPYRFLRHPNYVVVVAEIFVAPMVLGLLWVAVLFSILNAALLWVRIRAENAALDNVAAADQ